MRSSSLLVLFSVIFGPRAQASVDLSWRVKACVNRLTSARVPLLSRPKLSEEAKHNRRVIDEYQRHQDFEILRHGINHSDLTRYITALPELVEKFLRSKPEWNQLEFVINSGNQALFATDSKILTLYPKLDVLAVWRHSHLVYISIPRRLLDEVLLMRTPEKAVMRFLTQIKFDDESDAAGAAKMTKTPF